MPLEIKWLSLFSSFFTKNLFFKIKPVLMKKLERNSHRSEKKCLLELGKELANMLCERVLL